MMIPAASSPELAMSSCLPPAQHSGYPNYKWRLNLAQLKWSILLYLRHCDVIPMQVLLKELRKICALDISDTIMHLTIFVDNKVCVKLAKMPKMCPQMRHIAIKYHHFREYVCKGLIKVEWIETKDQVADILTKPLAGELFKDSRKKLLGW